MKKSIIALILAVSMLLTCSLTAMAASGDGGVDTGDTAPRNSYTIVGFNSENAGTVSLKDGETASYSFHNQSTGDLFYYNFVFFLTGNGEELGYIRADNWVDSKTGYFTAGTGTTNGYDMAVWQAEAKDVGFDVTVTISKTGNTLNYEAKMGEGGKYLDTFVLTSNKDLPETIEVKLTGEQCVLSNVSYSRSKTPAEPELPEGAVVIKEFDSVSAGTVALKDGSSATFSFHNKSTGYENWHNFVFFVEANNERLAYIRADNFGNGENFGGNFNGVTNGFDITPGWAAWMEESKTTGFDVTATIRRDGNTLTCEVTMGGGKYTDNFTITSNKNIPETIEVKLSGEQCVLSNISYFATAGENSGVGSKTVPLRDEGSYTFEFKAEPPAGVDKSDFSLAVTDGYGETLLTIKEDGEYTASAGYTFTETSAAAMAMALSTGTDVKIEISRAGNALTYIITKDGTVVTTKTLTADKDLPTTVNVQLTATNCTLNNVDVQGDDGIDPVIDYEEKTIGDLVITEFFSAKSEVFKLEEGKGFRFKFKNKSYGDLNWHNFILGITGDSNATDGTKEILLIRPDNYAWGGGGSYYGTMNGSTNVTNWGDFVQAATAGVDAEVSIGRIENILIFSAKLGEFTMNLEVNITKDCPDDMYVFISGEKCTLYTGDTEPARPTPAPAPAPAPEPTPEPAPSTPDDPVDGVAEAESIEGSLTANNFFNRKTGAVALKSGESLKLTFTNKSLGVENFHNYVLAVVGAKGSDYTGLDQEVLIIRADSYGWAGGLASFGALTFDTNVTDWEAFKTDAKAGMATEVLIERVGDTLHFLAKMGDKYTSEITATSSVALPETLYVFLTGEKVTLSGIASVKGEAGDLEPVEPDTPAAAEKIEGDLTVDGFLSAKTASIPLWDGGSYTFNFKAKSNGVENWHNFVLSALDDKGGQVLTIRADNYAWGDNGTYFEAAIYGETNITEADWEAFKAAAKAGFDVEVTIKREGDKLTYTAKMGEYTATFALTAKKPLPETLYIFLSGEKCQITGITTEGAPGKMPEGYNKPGESAGTKPQQTYTPKIEGNLTVTAFFLEKTNMVPLSSGDKYTFTFTNTSKGTNNYENFVVGIVGTNASPYPGAEKEILIVRADRYGWGGGMSDFVRPDEAGNALVFDSNIDWDKWVAACKAGVPVTVTVSRSGNTLNYEAAIGDWYVKLSATSGKALPKTAYLFLTGENCTLSNIKTVSAPTYSSPATGDTGAAVWAAVLAILASLGTAAVVLKRGRKPEEK